MGSRKKTTNKKRSTLKVGCAQYIGSRDNQEDSFAFSDLNDSELIDDCGFIAAVADGMGGLAFGSEASAIAVSSISDVYTNKTKAEPTPSALLRAVRAANESVRMMSEYNGAYGNAGTTLVSTVIIDNSLFYISVGDSRIYLFRDGIPNTLNVPHNYGNSLHKKMLNGEITQEDIDENPEKEHLTSYLGLDEIREIDYNQVPLNLRIDDMLILCSDGLFNTLSDDEISAILEKYLGQPQAAADALVSEVLNKDMPYQDNVTVAVIYYS